MRQGDAFQCGYCGALSLLVQEQLYRFGSYALPEKVSVDGLRDHFRVKLGAAGFKELPEISVVRRCLARQLQRPAEIVGRRLRSRSPLQ